MSMGIIDLVGRGLGCEMCGIVSASRATSFKSRCFLVHHNMTQKSCIWGFIANTTFKVRKVGPEVKHLKVGDRVLCCTDGSFATSWCMSELFCAKMPDSLSFDEAATIPLVYATVIAGLMD